MDWIVLPMILDYHEFPRVSFRKSCDMSGGAAENRRVKTVFRISPFIGIIGRGVFCGALTKMKKIDIITKVFASRTDSAAAFPSFDSVFIKVNMRS